MASIQYTTQDGERWDTIAYKAYGDVRKTRYIIEANPDVSITDRLPGGAVLNIPIINEDDAIVNAEDLPPWYRDASI